MRWSTIRTVLAIAAKNDWPLHQLDVVTAFLGAELRRFKDGILVTQIQYIEELLRKFNLQNCNSSRLPMDPNISTEPRITAFFSPQTHQIFSLHMQTLLNLGSYLTLQRLYSATTSPVFALFKTRSCTHEQNTLTFNHISLGKPLNAAIFKSHTFQQICRRQIS